MCDGTFGILAFCVSVQAGPGGVAARSLPVSTMPNMWHSIATGQRRGSVQGRRPSGARRNPNRAECVAVLASAGQAPHAHALGSRVRYNTSAPHAIGAPARPRPPTVCKGHAPPARRGWPTAEQPPQCSTSSARHPYVSWPRYASVRGWQEAGQPMHLSCRRPLPWAGQRSSIHCRER